MKKIISALFIGLIAFSSCSKCKKEDPRARVLNNGTESVSVQIQTSGGNTVNINNIASGESSDFKSYAAGKVDFTISVGNRNDFSKSVTMEECFEYDIAIDEDNNITSVPTDRNE